MHSLGLGVSGARVREKLSEVFLGTILGTKSELTEVGGPFQFSGSGVKMHLVIFVYFVFVNRDRLANLKLDIRLTHIIVQSRANEEANRI
jgi:hypothetical protein